MLYVISYTIIMVNKKTKMKKSKKEVIKKKVSKKEKPSYAAKDIYVLEGLEPVRKRPGMYIGTTGPEGLHHLIWEVLDNGIDECLAGYADEIRITLLPNNRVRCEDNGRGIPVDKHPQTKKSALETVMTTLHAGAKFGGKSYQVSGGLHGVGVSVVCALSSYLRAEICRDGFKYFQEYSQGKPKANVKKDARCRKTGTVIIFEPDREIFEEREFNQKKIIDHLRQQAYLTKGVRIRFEDQRTSQIQKYDFYFEGGISSFVKYLIRGNLPIQDNIFYVIGSKNEILVEAAFQYTQERECYEESFANNIRTKEGGNHLTGFRAALTRTFNDWARKNNYLKENEENLGGDDIKEGFNGIVSVKIKEPQFEGQTKAKLGNPEAKAAVEAVVSAGLSDFLERNPRVAKSIIENCLLAAKARKAAKAARQTVLRKGALDGLSLPGKLADCSSKKPEESELYIVEGESAGGCFFGNARVALIDGRNLTFKELVKEDKKGNKNYCYTIKENGRMGVSLIRNPRKTRRNVKVLKVILDNGEEIICTPDHLFMLRDGSYRKAENLSLQDSLMPLYRKCSRIKKGFKIDGYELIYEQKDHKWIYTHLLSDQYNLEKKEYVREKNSCVHHKNFRKLNNNPDNLVRMDRQKHLDLHARAIKETMARPDIQEKIRKAHQTKEYRQKIKAIMSRPEMREMLSKRAKKQWENGEYKQYMIRKFLEFYKNNKKYQEKNNKLLYENQKEYWASEKNRKRWAERMKKYFKEHPEKRKELSQKAKEQWQNQELLKWREKKTKEQWTPEFRVKRKRAYNQTYREKALKLMKEILEKQGRFNKEKYNQKRLKLRDKSLLRYDTICQRFFKSDEKRLKEAVINYNHKIREIIKLKERIDVYDLEVEGTHNFALASGIFVHNSSRQARDRRFQAILPLRGKILNVERARLDRILGSKEIKALIIALGTAIAQDFNLDKLRYHRVILMTDADVDGAHIRTLLLTLFYRYLQPIIEKGYLYIAQPPLYRIQQGKRVEYAYTDADKEEILSDIRKSRKTELQSKTKKGQKKKEEQDEEKIAGVTIQRYKGLGEMNPSLLWETTMSPENRILLQVKLESTREADHIFDALMGEEVFPRKRFIQAHAKTVKNLDI